MSPTRSSDVAWASSPCHPLHGLEARATSIQRVRGNSLHLQIKSASQIGLIFNPGNVTAEVSLPAMIPCRQYRQTAGPNADDLYSRSRESSRQPFDALLKSPALNARRQRFGSCRLADDPAGLRLHFANGFREFASRIHVGAASGLDFDDK